MSPAHAGSRPERLSGRAAGPHGKPLLLRPERARLCESASRRQAALGPPAAGTAAAQHHQPRRCQNRGVSDHGLAARHRPRLCQPAAQEDGRDARSSTSCESSSARRNARRPISRSRRRCGRRSISFASTARRTVSSSITIRRSLIKLRGAQVQELRREVHSPGDLRRAASRQPEQEPQDVPRAGLPHEVRHEVPDRIVLRLHRRRHAGADPVPGDSSHRDHHGRRSSISSMRDSPRRPEFRWIPGPTGSRRRFASKGSRVSLPGIVGLVTRMPREQAHASWPGWSTPLRHESFLCDRDLDG